MGLAQLKFLEERRARVSSPPSVPLKTLPRPEQMTAFMAVARLGSFSDAAEDLGVGQPSVSKRVRALEELLGVSLVERKTGALTPSGKDAARSMKAHLTRLAHDLGAIKAAQPSLTIALPSGRAGAALGHIIGAEKSIDLGPTCFVPAWSSASVTFRAHAGGEDCEDVFLFADEWAAVAGPGWTGPRDIDTDELKRLPLVAVTPEEHEAWHMILQRERPLQLFRASRAEADKMIADGTALGVANAPLLPGMPEQALKPVSRRHVWPGSGLWISVQNGTPAWDRGWALASALKSAFSARQERLKRGRKPTAK
ncbi:MAG: LysR family transcriptional regulator [Pseudomonadota bacterium]